MRNIDDNQSPPFNFCRICKSSYYQPTLLPNYRTFEFIVVNLSRVFRYPDLRNHNCLLKFVESLVQPKLITRLAKTPEYPNSPCQEKPAVASLEYYHARRLLFLFQNPSNQTLDVALDSTKTIMAQTADVSRDKVKTKRCVIDAMMQWRFVLSEYLGCYWL